MGGCAKKGHEKNLGKSSKKCLSRRQKVPNDTFKA